MWWRLPLAVVCISICISSQSSHQKRRCVFNVNPQNYKHIDARSVSGSVQECDNTLCCVGYFWMVDGQQMVDTQACDWVEKSCPDAICKAQPRFSNFSKCVCNTDFCNSNMTWPEEPSATYSSSADASVRTAGILIVVLVLIVFLLTTAKWRNFFLQTKENPPTSSDDNSVQPQCSCQATQSSHILHTHIETQQGKYEGSLVAVKLFPRGWKDKFIAEKEIYELSLMKHAGIASFLGTGRNPDDGSFFIVLQFAKYGSLHSFLCKHTMSWKPSLKMCQSLSQGLSYLHSDLYHHGVHKPPVAHRDLSSCNVLLREDLTCVLCDFESSTILRSCVGQPWWQSHTKSIEGQPVVCTLCYASPEVLEGSVNLNTSSFLMQGDIYALGLLLWEVWTRCLNLFQDGNVPQHLLPYQLELGANAPPENLIQHVCYLNQRPSIPQPWEGLPQGSVLKGILNECWDSDPDARLTADCVVNRLLSLNSS